MIINKHGLKITGLPKASGATWDTGEHSHYFIVYYDRKSGEVWANEYISAGRNMWAQYDSSSIIKVAVTSEHMTMQEIADAVKESVEFSEMLDEWREAWSDEEH